MSQSLEWINIVLQDKVAELFVEEWRKELEKTKEPITKVQFARDLIKASIKMREYNRKTK